MSYNFCAASPDVHVTVQVLLSTSTLLKNSGKGYFRETHVSHLSIYSVTVIYESSTEKCYKATELVALTIQTRSQHREICVMYFPKSK